MPTDDEMIQAIKALKKMQDEKAEERRVSKHEFDSQKAANEQKADEFFTKVAYPKLAICVSDLAENFRDDGIKLSCSDLKSSAATRVLSSCSVSVKMTTFGHGGELYFEFDKTSGVWVSDRIFLNDAGGYDKHPKRNAITLDENGDGFRTVILSFIKKLAATET
jgi:hypothetical protein